MTPVEAHVWIAVYAATYQAARIDVKHITAVRMADSAVEALRKSPKMEELNDAFRQGSDIP